MDVMSSFSAQVFEVASILPQTQKACCATESPALVTPEQGASAFLRLVQAVLWQRLFILQAKKV